MNNYNFRIEINKLINKDKKQEKVIYIILSFIYLLFIALLTYTLKFY